MEGSTENMDAQQEAVHTYESSGEPTSSGMTVESAAEPVEVAAVEVGPLTPAEPVELAADGTGDAGSAGEASADTVENELAGGAPKPENTGIVGNLQPHLQAKRCTIVYKFSRGQHQTMPFNDKHLAAHALEVANVPTDGTHLLLNQAGAEIPLDAPLHDYVRSGEQVSIVHSPSHTPAQPIRATPIVNQDLGFGQK